MHGTSVEKNPLACVLSVKSEIYVVFRPRLALSRAVNNYVLINNIRPSDYFSVF